MFNQSCINHMLKLSLNIPLLLWTVPLWVYLDWSGLGLDRYIMLSKLSLPSVIIMSAKDVLIIDQKLLQLFLLVGFQLLTPFLKEG